MRKTLIFEFVDTEEEAKNLVEFYMKQSSSYMKKKRPPYYLPWTSLDKTEHKFIVWHC